jgi:hypothetical protein
MTKDGEEVDDQTNIPNCVKNSFIPLDRHVGVFNVDTEGGHHCILP